MAQILTFRIPDRVAFRHSFFSTFTDARFRIGEDDNVPVISFDMGDQKTVLPLAGVKREFRIPEYSSDGVMLNTIIQALDFVSILRIGDPIPAEIRTGESSWTPTPTDHAAAIQRLTTELVAWNLSLDAPRSDPVQMQQFRAQYVNDETIRYALLRLAAHFGMGADGANRLAETMNDIAGELAHIESLRGRCAQVNSLGDKLVRMRKDFAHHASVMADLEPVIRMIKEPIRLFRQHFAEIDANLGEVVTMFGDVASLRDLLRSARNNLLRRLAPWTSITEEWGRLGPAGSDPFEMVPYLRELYRFLAPRFMPVDKWELILDQGGSEGGTPKLGSVVTWYEREPRVA